MKSNLQSSIFRVVGIIFTIFYVIPFNPVFGAILNVPNDYQTIQAAIDAAIEGDTVLVADGIYTGSGNKNISFSGKAITVKSANGPFNSIIDCESDGRGFRFNNQEKEISVLSGFTITNGYVYSTATGFTGGGIDIHNNSSPSIINCRIIGNQAALGGGGINCSWDSSPSILNCVIKNNISEKSGGGIEISLRSSPSVRGCAIAGNLAYYSGGGINCSHQCAPIISNCIIASNSTYFDEGGAISAYQSSLMIEDCTMSGNGGKKGGGLYFQGCPSPVKISNCDIFGNYSLSGGGIYWQYTSPEIINCRITKNRVISSTSPTLSDSGFGGGVLAGVPNRNVDPLISDSIISGNNAGKSGGGIYAISKDGCTRSFFLTNCLISGNKAGQGGGLFVEKKNGCDIAFTFKNCTIAANKADSGGGIYYSETSSKSKIINTIIWGNTIDQVNIPNLYVTYSNIAGGYTGSGNIDSNPDFICSVQKNFRLRASSPCIDAGNYVDAPNVDIEGNLRPQGEKVDLGAYEGAYTDKCKIPPSIFHMLMHNSE